MRERKLLVVLPMSIRCLACENSISKGSKFFARKEDVQGEKYLEKQVYRIHFHCNNCLSEITFKSDPPNPDYIIESGATRIADPEPEPSPDEHESHAATLSHQEILAILRRLRIQKEKDQSEGF